MSAKLVTARRLAWSGILLAIILVLLFLRGIPQQLFRKGAANANTGESSTPANSPTAPGIAGVRSAAFAPGSESADHAVIFRVIDAATGAGIEGASLHLGPINYSEVEGTPLGGELITDKDGRRAVTVTPPIAMSVRADGYISRRAEFRAGEDCPAEYTFKLEKGGTIGGYVRDEGGKPIRDAKLRIRASYQHALDPKPTDRESFNTSLQFQTDASGRWKCTEFRSDALNLEFRLTHPEYVQRDYETDTSLAMEDPYTHQKALPVAMAELKEGKAVLLMEYGFLVTGMVADETGKAIEGATVSRMAGARASSTFSTTPDGRFTFTVGKREETALMVEAKGFAPEFRTIQVVPRMPDIEFRLGKGQVVSGRVVDDDGKPIAGAVVKTDPGASSVPPFPWQDMTDTEGRFLWDSAPAQTLLYRASAQGFNAMRESLALQPFKENEIKLQRAQAMHVSGKVVDSKTKMPIDKFTVAVWVRMHVPVTSAEGKNGEFAVSLTDQETKYGFTVEAAGYLPDTSQSLDFQEGDWKLDIALVRGDGPSGIVKLPSGEAAAEANVFLCGGYMPMGPNSQEKMPQAAFISGLKNVRSGPNLTLANATTDESGRFTLEAVPDAHTVIATHEKGFAAVALEQLTASGTLILEPWGHVEGTVRIGTKAGADQRVVLRTLISSYHSPAFSVSLSTNTDAEGKFVFPMVPAGEYHIATSLTSSFGESQPTSTIVRSGETTSVKLGGMGCPVIGRAVIVGSGAQVDWRRATAGISLKLPATQAPNPQDGAAYSAWLQSEEHKNQLRSQRSYAFVFAEDGSFRGEDIPAGAYILTIRVTITDPSQPIARPTIQTITKEFVVPEMDAGRSDKPLDLGALTLQIIGKQ